MNFDQINQRRNTRSIKWDTHGINHISLEAIPMWVADMDFKTLPAITEALHKEVDLGIYGYSYESDEYFNAVTGWMKRRHQWDIQKEWLYTTPGVVSALNACIKVLSKENEAILIQEPVYYPFKRSILANNRHAISNPLRLKEGHYEIDFEDFEQKILQYQVKAFILCNPHNPVGRVYTNDELNRMVDICQKHSVSIIADEIHMDFVFKPHHHTVLQALRPEYADHIITLSAASKTFNLAAFKVSQLTCSNRETLASIKKEYSQLGMHGHNTLGLLSTEMAYTHGDSYVDELIEYISKNVETLRYFISSYLPQVKLIEPEGLYLMWLDFRALNLSQEDLKTLLSEKALLWLNDGSTFGEGGEGFMRMNLATPNSELIKALHQLKEALKV